MTAKAIIIMTHAKRGSHARVDETCQGRITTTVEKVKRGTELADVTRNPG